jgi:ribonuclease P/MRP protein subunit POP7
MSAIKRIRSSLSQISKRRTQSIFASASNSQHRNSRPKDKILAAAVADAQSRENLKDGEGECVLVKGTGRVVEKVLSVAGFFQDNAKKEGAWVRIETGSVWVIDDVEVVGGDDGGGEMGVDDKGDDVEEVPETRLRQVSVLEVRIGLR